MDLSIIIPTYKTMPYLIETIDSINRQNIEDFDIEIIVVLNGDKYPYYDLITSVKTHLKYKVIHTKTKGVSNARNIGIENSSGKYIMFIDDDDLLSDDYLSTLLNMATDESTIYSSNVKCFIDGTDEYFLDYIGQFIKNRSKQSDKVFNINTYSKLMSSVWCKLIPRQVIGDYRFNPKISISEDALFMFAISDRIKDVEIAENIFYCRRVRDNSALTQKKKNKTHFANYLKFVSLLTAVYISKINKYNFMFYINRVGASTKFLIKNIRA